MIRKGRLSGFISPHMLWSYWSLSRDGNYVVLDRPYVFSELLHQYRFHLNETIIDFLRSLSAITDRVILLRDGMVMWEKPLVLKEEEFNLLVNISSNNRYIVSINGSHYGYYFINLCSLNGDTLWRLKIKGSPRKPMVTDYGEVLLSLGERIIFIKDGKILWEKECDTASRFRFYSSTRDGNRIVICDEKGISVFNRFGELIWEYQKEPISSKVDIATDNGYIVISTPENEVILFSPSGKILYRKKISEICYNARISPNGRYFAILTEDGFVYFFENQYTTKEKLIKEIEKLLI